MSSISAEAGLDLNIRLLESSFETILPRFAELADIFYGTLFEEHPELRSLFSASMEDQKALLAAAITTIISSLREPEKLSSFLEELGRRHVDDGAQAAHYAVVGSALLRSIQSITEPEWTPELERAWADAYGFIQETMLSGAGG